MMRSRVGRSEEASLMQETRAEQAAAMSRLLLMVQDKEEALET